MKLFAKIQELVSDRESLVCILIDEVRNQRIIAMKRGGGGGEDR